MASSARHTRTPQRLRSRALFRATLAVSAAGAALVGSGASEAAATSGSTPDAVNVTSAVPLLNSKMVKGRGITAPAALTNTLGTLKHLQANPWARTPVDPLNNSVETKIADFKPAGTKSITAPLSDGAKIGEIPATRPATDALPG
ncbi:hypothetical protein ACQUSR_20115 [Streptomyces sp. P1-3]|uniref:hypothetical protein n=1 Tax=Streptomyces sp. P1-3 TaxID=3421658 RepID=UPI003D3648CF